jgi:hypothetical protein
MKIIDEVVGYPSLKAQQVYIPIAEVAGIPNLEAQQVYTVCTVFREDSS